MQDGLKRINFPVLWIKVEPAVIVSQVNPIGMKRLEDLQKSMPTMQVRDFGEGYHFLAEENPARVSEMVSEWINELN